MLLYENVTKADSRGNKDGTNCQCVSLLNFLNDRGKENKVRQEQQS